MEDKDGVNRSSTQHSKPDLLAAMAADMKALQEGMEALTGTVNELKTKIMDKIHVVIKQETREFNNELELLKGRISQLVDKIKQGLSIKSGFDIDRSVIIINLAQHEGEDVVALCTGLFTNVLEVAATVTQAECTAQRDPNRPAVIKCELATAGEKINILRNKKKCKDNGDTTRVFSARMRSHEERLIENNIKTLLNEFPDMKNNFRFTGSGRLVDKRQASQKEMGGESEQHDSDEHRQRNEDTWQTVGSPDWSPTAGDAARDGRATRGGRGGRGRRSGGNSRSPITPGSGRASTQRGGGKAGSGGTFGDINRRATRNMLAAGADGNRGDRR